MIDYRLDRTLKKHIERTSYIGSQHPMLIKVKQIIDNKSPDTERLFVASGMCAHQKLLITELGIKCCIVCPDLIYSDEGIEMLDKVLGRAEEIFIISQKLYERICNREDPDGLTSIVHLPSLDIGMLPLKNWTNILVLDGLENPGNIGTILRTCDGARVDAVVVCNKKARITNPKLIKASMGAVFSIPIIEMGNTDQCINWLKENNFSIYLADTRADKTYKDYNYSEKTALVVGNERYGISSDWYDNNPKLLSIPMLGICDSLNAGVAASIMVYEICMRKLETELYVASQ